MSKINSVLNRIMQAEDNYIDVKGDIPSIVVLNKKDYLLLCEEKETDDLETIHGLIIKVEEIKDIELNG